MLVKKFPRLAILLVVVMALGMALAACGDKTQATPAQSTPLGFNSQLAGNFPDSTALFVSLNTDETSQQTKSWQNVVKYLQSIPELSDALKSLTKSATSSTNTPALSMTPDLNSLGADIQGWAGKEVALGLTDLSFLTKLTDLSSNNPMTALSGEIPVLAAFDVKDKAKADAFIQKLFSSTGMQLKPTTENYKDYTIYNYNLFILQISAALSNNKLLIGAGPKLVKSAIDQGAQNSLASNAQYSKVAKNVPAANVGFVYLDTAATAKFASSLPATLSKNTTTSVNMKLPEYLAGTGLSFSTADKGLRLDVYQSYNADKMTADEKAMFTRSGSLKNTIIEALPANTFFFATGQDGKSTWDQVSKALSQLPADQAKQFNDAIAKFQTDTGLNVNTDLAGLFAGEFSLFATAENNADHPASIGLLTAVDKNNGQASLDKIAAAITKSNGTQFQDKTFKDVKYKSASVKNEKSGKTMDISLGIAGNNAFVSSSQAQTEALITAASGASQFKGSAAYQDFNNLKSFLPESNTGYFYLDIQQALGVAKNAQVPADSKAGSADAKATFDKVAGKLTQLKSVAGGSKVSSAEQTTTVYLNFPVTNP